MTPKALENDIHKAQKCLAIEEDYLLGNQKCHKNVALDELALGEEKGREETSNATKVVPVFPKLCLR